MTPKYPVYVISKGRWPKPGSPRSSLTFAALERMGVPYHLVIEPTELDAYAAHVRRDRILTLPFHDLGQGSIPARNWVWDHATESGVTRHWILDDNIEGFYRFNRNAKRKVDDGTIFRAAEDFVDRYANVAMAGFQYEFFVTKRSGNTPPFLLNTRVYSCILLANDIPFCWRGRYNEDTDLSLRILKAGYCTILFNAFLANKTATMMMKGGNTDELYRQDAGFDGRLEMAKSLQHQHPDVTKIVRKWGRWQHHVDYRPFRKNRLVLRKDVEVKEGVDDYGMILRQKEAAA